MRVTVLGAEYTITVKKYDEDKAFERDKIGGYCNSLTREIVVCDMATYPEWEHENEKTVKAQMRVLIRHEIVHAFLEESGLSTNSNDSDGAWARNEEMVDWFAIQGLKIYEAWEEAGAL